MYKLRGVTLLTVHLWLGILTAALTVGAVWWRLGRRITLYVVTAQILLGNVLFVQRLQAPWYHYALAAAGWAGYMVASAFERRGASRGLVLTISAVSSILILVAFAIGQGAVHRGTGST